jgi:hypothetical protein
MSTITQVKTEIKKIVKEELSHFSEPKHPDHEAKMAKGELRDMIKLGAELYKMIEEGSELPGWVSAYITLSADYIHSVHQYMNEQKS